MLKRPITTTVVAILLASCSNSPEDRVAKAAARMNALKNPALDVARAEGNTLVVRYKPLGLQDFSDAELTKLSTAGLCTIDGVKDMLASGAAIRLELPRRGDYLGIDIDRCDGAKGVVKTAAAPAPTTTTPATSAADWPTSATIER